jgi:hypothetical protein
MRGSGKITNTSYYTISISLMAGFFNDLLKVGITSIVSDRFEGYVLER